MSRMLVVLLVLGIFLLGLPTTKASNDTLIFVQTLSRHGARSPIDTYPGDIYNESQWQQGYGQLTQKGMHGAMALGDFLRERYVQTHPLLSAQYDRNEVYVMSSDVDRTLLTARLSMDHLFPSTNPLNPVPIHTIAQSTDNLLYSSNCVVLNERLNEDYMMSEIKKLNEKFGDMLIYLYEHLNFSPHSYGEVGSIADNLKCTHFNNFTLPAWASGDNIGIFYMLMDFINAQFEVQFNRYDNAKLKSGLLLGDIVESLKRKAGADSDFRHKARFYYAHDTTVAPLLAALKVYNNLQPPFASTILIELYKTNNSNNNKDENKSNNKNGGKDELSAYYVKVLFRNDSKAQPVELELPGCQVNCPLHTFIELTKANVVSDWDAVCLKEKEMPLRDILLLVTSASLLLCVVIIFICSILFCRKKTPYHRYIDVPTEIE